MKQIGGWSVKIMHGQKMNKLSRANKEVMLKVVEQTIRTDFISIFLFLKTICLQLKRIVTKFWNGKKKKR